MRALAVDLGGSHATCALVEDRTIIRAKTLATEGSVGLGPILPSLADALCTVMQEAETGASQCAGLAFCFCGLVDHAQAKVISTNAKYDDAPRLDLKGWCENHWAFPSRLKTMRAWRCWANHTLARRAASTT